MRTRSITMLTIATALAVAAIGVATPSGAQDTRTTDARLYPFLGCWQGEHATGADGALTCAVPVSGSRDVELLTISGGRVTARRRIGPGARTHAVQGQGCTGDERTTSSSEVRRIYLRSEYLCGSTGIAGGETSLFSILPSGEWLAVANVRASSGSMVHVERRRDVGIPADVPREVAAKLGGERLAVATARAEAASPIRSADVVEALHATDTAVVRAWLAETAQPFRLTGDEVASLIRQQVPSSVLQAMMATPPSYQLGRGVDANGWSTDSYLNSPGAVSGVGYAVAGPIIENVYVETCCAQPVYEQSGYYPAPVILYGAPLITRGHRAHEGFGQPNYRQPPPPYATSPAGMRAPPSAGPIGLVSGVPVRRR